MSDPLPFPNLAPEKIEQIVRPPLFPSTTKRRFAVSMKPLVPEIKPPMIEQEHIWLDKNKVYGYLRSLYPYPEIRGRAREEINNADVALFDIYRIPKPGHCPVGLEGLVYDVPSEVPQQTPLSLDLVGKGKEIIIEGWPPSYPKVHSQPEEQSPTDLRHELQLSGPQPTDDEDDLLLFDDILQDGQELLPPSPARPSPPSPVGGEKSKNTVNIASTLGGLVDDLQEELADQDGHVELFDEPEVFAEDVAEITLSPPLDVALPMLSVEEFIVPPTTAARMSEVRNNGSVRFVIVSRTKGSSDDEWKIPSWNIASQVVNEVMNSCFADNLYCFKAFHWANPWKGAGLVSLYSSPEYVKAMVPFRTLFTGSTLEDFPDLEFNTFPKDLLPPTKISILLKSPLKNFNPKFIPRALFSHTSSLSGSLKLHSVKPVLPDDHHIAKNKNKGRKSEPKIGWRVATLKGNAKFFDSLKNFHEAHAFPLGCAHVHIRGGVGRSRGPQTNRRSTSSTSATLSSSTSSASSTSSSALPSSSSSSSAPAPASSILVPYSSTTAPPAISTIVVPEVSRDMVMVAPDEMESILLASQSQPPSSSGIIAAALVAAASSDPEGMVYPSGASGTSTSYRGRGKKTSQYSGHRPGKDQAQVQAQLHAHSFSSKAKGRGRGKGRGGKSSKKTNNQGLRRE